MRGGVGDGVHEDVSRGRWRAGRVMGGVGDGVHDDVAVGGGGRGR